MRNDDHEQLNIAGIEKARDLLLRDPPDWPRAGSVDTSGVQLIVAAIRSGKAPPADVLGDGAVRTLMAALGFDPDDPVPSATQ